jgi:hypothetical protein
MYHSSLFKMSPILAVERNACQYIRHSPPFMKRLIIKKKYGHGKGAPCESSPEHSHAGDTTLKNLIAVCYIFYVSKRAYSSNLYQ